MDGIPQIENFTKEREDSTKLFLLRHAESLYGLDEESLSFENILDLVPIRGGIYYWTIAAIIHPDGHLRVCTITQPERQADYAPTDGQAILANNKYIEERSTPQEWVFESPVPASDLSYDSQTNRLKLKINNKVYNEAKGRGYRSDDIDE